jgi:hypothetical protein
MSKRIDKPLLEVSLLTKQLEASMMNYMVTDLGMSSDEAIIVLHRSKKNGSFDRSLAKVVKDWWSNY